jgi:hypothetical protein
MTTPQTAVPEVSGTLSLSAVGLDAVRALGEVESRMTRVAAALHLSAVSAVVRATASPAAPPAPVVTLTVKSAAVGTGLMVWAAAVKDKTGQRRRK